MSQVGGDSDLLLFGAERVAEGIDRVMGQGKGFHRNPPEFECRSRIDHRFPFRQKMAPVCFHQGRRGHIHLDLMPVGKRAAAPDMVGMLMRDQDPLYTVRFDLPQFHPPFQFPGAESGVQQQCSFRSVNDRGIAFASASQHRDPEFSCHFFLLYSDFFICFFHFMGYYNPFLTKINRIGQKNLTFF